MDVNGNKIIEKEGPQLFDRVVSILEQARKNVVRSVNSNMVIAHWLIGREIVEEIQAGDERAEYGKRILGRLSEQLSTKYGTGFSVSNLRNFRQFYSIYQGRSIHYPSGSELQDDPKHYPEGSESHVPAKYHPAGDPFLIDLKIGNLTLEDLRKGNVSQRRNPLTADLFRRIEMVEAWGRGMPLILKYAPDVVFRETGNLFIVTFNRTSFLAQKDEGQAITQETTQETTQEKIMASLRAEPALTRKLLAQRLNISEDGVKYHLNKLKAAGKIRHVGPTKGGRWEVIEDRLDASDNGAIVGGDE